MEKGILVLERTKKQFIAGVNLVRYDELTPDIVSELLHSEEKEYVNGLKFKRRKDSYLLGRIAAKYALKKTMREHQNLDSIVIDRGVFEFPTVKYLHKENLEVSISHTDTIGIAVACSNEHPIGVDIEKISTHTEASMKTVLHARECDLIKKEGLYNEIGFTMLWTVKESLSKIFKTGLMADFKIFEVEKIIYKNGVYKSLFKNFSQYKALSYQYEDYFITVVLPKKTKVKLELD